MSVSDHEDDANNGVCDFFIKSEQGSGVPEPEAGWPNFGTPALFCFALRSSQSQQPMLLEGPMKVPPVAEGDHSVFFNF